MVHSHSSSDSRTHAWPSILGSAASGLVELTLFHGVDTISKRLMTNTIPYNIPGQRISLLNEIIFREYSNRGKLVKFASLYPGFKYAAGYKITQRIYKYSGQTLVDQFLRDQNSRLSDRYSKSTISAFAGLLVGLGEVALLPLDVLKIKAQTNPEALRGKNFIGMLSKDLYSGIGWTAARNAFGSFALFGASSLIYDSFYQLSDRKRASVEQVIIASAVGSVASITFSAPFDVIKTRIQKQDFGVDQKGIGFSVGSKLIAEEGIRGLFKGFLPKILVVAPKLTVSFALAQLFTAKFEEWTKRGWNLKAVENWIRNLK